MQKKVQGDRPEAAQKLPRSCPEAAQKLDFVSNVTIYLSKSLPS